MSARQPHPDIYSRAAGYGIPGRQVDGNDVEAVWASAHDAVDRARRGNGPSLVEYRTYRWRGHVGPECDWEKGCRPREELLDWMERCPIESFRNELIRTGVIDDKWYTEHRATIKAEIGAAQEAAKASAPPKPEELETHLFYES